LKIVKILEKDSGKSGIRDALEKVPAGSEIKEVMKKSIAKSTSISSQAEKVNTSDKNKTNKAPKDNVAKKVVIKPKASKKSLLSDASNKATETKKSLQKKIDTSKDKSEVAAEKNVTKKSTVKLNKDK
jgi:hypothetical protein